MQRYVLYSGSSHEGLSQEIAGALETELGERVIKRFPDGEIFVEFADSVRGADLFVVQSVAVRPNAYLMELLIMIDALKRASARQIIPVIPYFGYARQDRRGMDRVPLTAKLVADLLQTAGATRVLTMDLHSEQIQGFFDVPVDNLLARPVLVNAIKALKLSNLIVVAPDVGSVKIARDFAKALGVEFAVVDKQRLSAKEVEVTTIIGDVRGCDVVLVDDVIATAGTLTAAAKACSQAGARRVIAAASHGLFVGGAEECLADSPIEAVFVSDTVPRVTDVGTKIQSVSAAGLFAEAIKAILSDRSVSSLFVN